MRSVISLAIVFIISFTVGGVYCKSDVSPNTERISKMINSTTETETQTETTTEIETTAPETTTESTTKEETTTKATRVTTTFAQHLTDDGYVSPQFFRKMGIIYGNGYKFTWYSENVLPGGGLNIPGRHSDGYYVRDEDEYIVLASSPDLGIPQGTVIETPFGMGKVYDVCETPGVIDVYTSF